MFERGKSVDRRTVKRFEDALARALSEVVLNLRSDLGRDPTDVEIVDAIRSYPWDEMLEAPVGDIFADSGSTIVEAAGSKAWARAGWTGAFNVDNPYSRTFLRKHGADLVTGLSAESKRALRLVMERSFREGIDVRRRARLIENVVGLDRRGAANLASLESALAEKGARDIEGKLARRRKKLIRRRAMNISRTEATNAHAQGVWDSWRSADDQMFLGPSPHKRWIAGLGQRTCKVCRELHGQEVPLRSPFWSSVLNRYVDRPAAHPACRCQMGLTFPDARS